MKKTNFILGLILLIMASFTLPAHQQISKEQNKDGNVVTFINAYCATGNPTSDYIYVHLWNATRITISPYPQAHRQGMSWDRSQRNVAIA